MEIYKYNQGLSWYTRPKDPVAKTLAKQFPGSWEDYKKAFSKGYRGSMEEFVESTIQRKPILPEPKPERPVEDQYQDYKQVQEYFEPRTQMYIEKELGFDEGGRIGFDRGGMANVLKYLEGLEPGTNITMDDIKTIAQKNKWEFNSSTLYRMLNNPDRKQIAKSGNEVFLYGEENRNRAKNIMQRINFEQKLKIKPSEEVFKKIDLMIADKEKFPSMKSIGEELGYKPTKPGEGGYLRLESPLMKEYQKSRGRNLILEMRFKEYRLTKDSPWVKKVIATRKELGSTRATAKKLKVDRKTIRNITEQFAPNMFGNVNLRKSDKWNYKKVRAKREAELAKRLGGKNNPAFLQYMDLWEDIVDANEDILRMSDDAIFNNPRIKMAMNVDVTGLTIDEPLNFDKYKNLSKKEFAQKVRDMAKTNQFFQAEHSIPIASEKIAAAYPNNLQVAQGKIGSQLEAMKTYIRNNPNGKHIPQINEFLNEFDIQIREGGKTYGWTNPNNKSGLNVYNTQPRTSDIVESAFDKNASNTIFNKNLKNINVGSRGSNVLSFLGTGQMESGLSKFGKSKLGKGVTLLAKGEGIFAPLFLYGGAAYGLPFTRNINEASYGILGKSKSEYLIDKHPKAKRVIELLDAQTEYNTLLDNYKKATPATQLQFKNKMLAKQKEFEEKAATFNAIPEEEKMELGQAYQVAEQSYEDELKQRRERHFSNYIIPKKELFTDIAGNLSSVFETPVSATENVFGAPIPTGQVQTEFANGGIASLTRTVAPPRGPQHMGLASFKKRGR